MSADNISCLVGALDILFPDDPYFGGSTQGIQGDYKRHAVLIKLAQSLAHRGKLDILEVGSWTGCSTTTWAVTLGGMPQRGTITCVDPWKSYMTPHDESKGGLYPVMNRMLDSGLAYALFLHNIKFISPEIGISHHVGTLGDVRSKLGYYDLIYLDGSHYYHDVVADIRHSHALLRDGGILCGDDLEAQLHEVNVDWARANLNSDFMADPSGTYYHPGVTLAVGERFGPVWSNLAVWAVRKTGDTYDKFDLK